MQLRQKISGTESPMQSPRFNIGWKGLTEIESWIAIFRKRVECVLDAENTWKEFRKEISTATPSAAERYIRINPRTSYRAPKMDDKAQVYALQEEVRSKLKSHTGTRVKIRVVAHRLVASSFYFERSGPPRVADDHIILQGNFLY